MPATSSSSRPVGITSRRRRNAAGRSSTKHSKAPGTRAPETCFRYFYLFFLFCKQRKPFFVFCRFGGSGRKILRLRTTYLRHQQACRRDLQRRAKSGEPIPAPRVDIQVSITASATTSRDQSPPPFDPWFPMCRSIGISIARAPLLVALWSVDRCVHPPPSRNPLRPGWSIASRLFFRPRVPHLAFALVSVPFRTVGGC